MANTPTSKVIFGTETLIDLTGDTAEAGDVLLGKSFHLASGAQGTGTLNPALKEDIAGVEPSSTASAAHASGTYLYYNNVLYKATADIAQGDSIVTSGASQNVEPVTVGGELVTLNTSLANKQDKPIVYSVTTSNVSSVRFPASGTDSNITTSSKVVAFASDNSGKPQKYSAINVYAGYVQITLPAVNTSTVTYEVHIYN